MNIKRIKDRDILDRQKNLEKFRTANRSKYEIEIFPKNGFEKGKNHSL